MLRFRQITDTGNVNLGTIIRSTIITTANNIPSSVIHSANVSRRQVDVFEIDGKTGCYIIRTCGASVVALFEESALIIIADQANTVIEAYGNKEMDKSLQIVKELQIAFGVEWRVSGSVLLSYGIRSAVNKDLRFRNILPLASISCLMR